jgi:hypothetical protein
MLDFGVVLKYSKIYIFGTRNLNGRKADLDFYDLCIGHKRCMDTSEFHPSACARSRQVNALMHRNAGGFSMQSGS